MTEHARDVWYQANHFLLGEALQRVRGFLEAYIAAQQGMLRTEPESTDPTELPDDVEDVSALDSLGQLFGLTAFERNVLVLCAGVELDGQFAALCAEAQGDPSRTYPTFSLALAAFPDPAWSALSPEAPLRFWKLIAPGAHQQLTTSPLQIDPRILMYLLGIESMDEQLRSRVTVVAPVNSVVPSQYDLAQHLATIWDQGQTPPAPFQLCGTDAAAQRTIASATCQILTLRLARIARSAVPSEPYTQADFLRRWEREALLSGWALMLDADEDAEPTSPQTQAAIQIVNRLSTYLFIAAPQRRPWGERTVLTFEVDKPTPLEQAVLWKHALELALDVPDAVVARLTTQFDVKAQTIHAASAEVLAELDLLDVEVVSDQEVLSLLWNACRRQTRPQMDDLAQRIEPKATWDDLVLPTMQKEKLHELVLHVRHRYTVYEEWGFAERSGRGLGTTALFAGASGTGKTMAAEVVARALQLDLYRIDLSAIMSKYIGETEKNLRRVFEAAEAGGVILLFDEADALFSKRTNVRDSHDHYANSRINYLLQLMEAYRGLAVLTTNLKENLDTAFLRRLRFILQFPFPNVELRAEMWERVFPSATPTFDLQIDKLARLTVTGGSIRNIALNAAFLAADAGDPVTMQHLLQATRSEYAKQERTLTEAEIRGWT